MATKPQASYAAPRCPLAEAQGGINLNAIFPVPGAGIDIRISSPGNTSGGDIAIVYWGSADNVVGQITFDPNAGHAHVINVSGALARRVTAENTRAMVEVWYVVILSDFGDQVESERLSVLVDFQPPGGVVPPEHQSSVNPSLRPIPELDRPIRPGLDLMLNIPDWAFMAAADRLYLRWGSRPIGPVVIGQNQVGLPVPITVPWDVVSGVDGGRAIVSYYIIDAIGNDSRYSAGQRVAVLPKPVIPETNGTPFLDGGLASARLVVPADAALQLGDTVTGFFASQSLGSLPATPGAAHTFNIPGTLIAPNQGKVVESLYTVTRAGSSHSSEVLSVAITQVQIPNFPPPTVPEATGGVLPGNAVLATLRVPANAGLVTGDTVSGVFANNALGTRLATPGAAMDFPIGGALIAANRGRTVSCMYWVLRNGTSSSSAIYSVTVTNPVDEWHETFDFDLVPPPFRDLSSRENQIDNPLRFDNVFDWRFDVDHLPSQTQFIGVKAVAPPYMDDYYRGNVLRIGDDSASTNVEKRIFVDLFRGWSRVRFAVSRIDDPFSVSFRNANLDLVGPVQQFAATPPQREVVSITAPAGTIRHIEIHCRDTIHIDFFKFRR